MNIQVNNAGSVTGLLKTRPFLIGEIFIQDKDFDFNTSEAGELKDGYLIDAATNAKITVLHKGDLFGGCNEWFGEEAKKTGDKNQIVTKEHPRVYVLGSGSSLKFGSRIIYQYDETDGSKMMTELMNNPNTLYLYMGNPTRGTITDEGQLSVPSYENKLAGVDGYYEYDRGFADDHRKDSALHSVEPGDAGYVATKNEAQGVVDIKQNITSRIDTGDLVFYSTLWERVIVWHLSRSQASLVRFNCDEIDSKTLKFLIKSADNNGYDYTLADFLNGSVRNYQSLTEQGWTEVEVGIGEGNLVGSIPGFASEGNIFYVPFKTKVDSTVDPEDANAKSRYINPQDEINITWRPIYDQANTGMTIEKAHAGDIIIFVPKDGGGIQPVVIGILRDFIANLTLEKFKTLRADGYATERYGDADIEIIDGIQTGEKGLADLLNYFGQTKADIDPVTQKIIASQLPSFLLGGMRRVSNESFVRAVSSMLASGDSEGPSLDPGILANLGTLEERYDSDTIKDVLKSIVAKMTGDTLAPQDEDSDSTKDEDENGDNSEYDEAMLDSVYFIWNNGTYEIPADSKIFSDKGDEDEVYKDHSGVTKAINNGDLLIFDLATCKFEIIDNTNTLTSIIIHPKNTKQGVYLSGTPTFTNEIKSAGRIVFNSEKENVVTIEEDTAIEEATIQMVAFNNRVTFKDDFKVVPYGNSYNRLPLISKRPEADLYAAYDSPWELGNSGDDSPLDTLKYLGAKKGVTFRNEFAETGLLTLPWHFYFGADDLPQELEVKETEDSGLILLPRGSGTLVTDNFLKEVIEDLLSEVEIALANIYRGTVDVLQTVKEFTDENGDTHKYFGDSPIKAIYEKDGTRESYVNISPTHKSSKVTEMNGSSPAWHSGITLDSATGVPALPDSANEDVPVLKLPTYSGNLLNDNSIIFCGYWD